MAPVLGKEKAFIAKSACKETAGTAQICLLDLGSGRFKD